MQIASSNGAFPHSGGGNIPDITGQLSRQRMRHRRILLMRAVQAWWFPILLVVVGGLVAAVLGQYASSYPLIILGVLCALPFIFVSVRRLEFGLLLVAIIAAPFSPLTFSLKSLEVDPPVVLLLTLFVVFVLQKVFHTGGKRILPSFWVLWPLFGLLFMAVVSNLVVQITWTRAVPHKLNGSPLINDELYGVLLFTFPLLVTSVTTMCLIKK